MPGPDGPSGVAYRFDGMYDTARRAHAQKLQRRQQQKHGKSDGGGGGRDDGSDDGGEGGGGSDGGGAGDDNCTNQPFPKVRLVFSGATSTAAFPMLL